jgi:polysaccharide pyruvyl transferase WcaK-like protein
VNYSIFNSFLLQVKWIMKASIFLLRLSMEKFLLKEKKSDLHGGRVAYIIGWYGTETLGDKLILLGLIDLLRERYDMVAVVSSDPSYTAGTILELSSLSRPDSLSEYIDGNIRVISYAQLLRAEPGANIIFGGGPLMDDPAVIYWYFIVRYLKSHGAAFMALGIGIGPLRYEVTRYFTSKLLSLANGVVLRPTAISGIDVDADNYPRALCPSFLTKNVLLRNKSHKKESIGAAGLPRVSINLRQIPPNYAAPGTSDKSLRDINGRLQEIIRDLVLANLKKYTFAFFSTHEYDLVGDSRIHLDIINSIDIAMENETSIGGVLALLEKSDFIISTRYHGFIIGLLLGKKSMGLDYTEKGGKLQHLYHYLFDRKPLNIFDLTGGVDAISFEPEMVSIDSEELDIRIAESKKVYARALNQL